jgi:hypothetical protein
MPIIAPRRRVNGLFLSLGAKRGNLGNGEWWVVNGEWYYSIFTSGNLSR